MKSMFRWLVILGLAAGAVYAVTLVMRRRATAPEPPLWVPPTVEAPAGEDEERAEAEGMTSPGPVDEPRSGAGEVVVAEPVVAEPEPERLAVADEEGMAGPAEETVDAAIGSSGEPLVAAEPGPAEDDLARAEDEGMTPVAAVDADEPGPGPAATIEPDAEALAAGETAGLPAIEEEPPVDAAFDAAGEPVEPIEAHAEADVAALPRIDDADEGQTGPTPTAHDGEAGQEIAPEKDFLTTYFEELAATPISGEEAPTELIASVEEALSDLEPAAIVPPPRRSAESYLDEGNVYFNVGQYALAIERYTQALQLDANLTAAYYNRANARTRSGDFDGALGDYNRALELQPNDADALNNRGMLHLYRANYSAALRDFNGALSADPTDTTVMVNRGLAHLHSGDSAAALVDFQEAIRMDSSDAAAHYGAAQASASAGNRGEALRYIERTLALDPAYAREAAGDPRLQSLQGDEDFLRLLRQSGSRSG